MVIKELKSDQSRIILTAEKGVAMVVMDRQDYIAKAQCLLAPFQRLHPQT